MHFPCEHCQHHGYLTLIRHIDKYGFKHTIKNILTRGNRK